MFLRFTLWTISSGVIYLKKYATRTNHLFVCFHFSLSHISLFFSFRSYFPLCILLFRTLFGSSLLFYCFFFILILFIHFLSNFSFTCLRCDWKIAFVFLKARKLSVTWSRRWLVNAPTCSFSCVGNTSPQSLHSWVLCDGCPDPKKRKLA